MTNLGNNFYEIGGSVRHLHETGDVTGFRPCKLLRVINRVFTYECLDCKKQLTKVALYGNPVYKTKGGE